MPTQLIDERPIIIIDLPGKLQDFLIHEFGTDASGSILLNRKNPLGKYINSMWSVSDLPVKQTPEHPCRIALPITPDMHYIVKCNFLYVAPWKQTQIEEFVEALFCTKIREFFVTGYEKGFKQTKIIDGILESYNWKNNALNFDMIKKMDYRVRRKSLKEVVSEIQNASVV